MEIKVHLSVTRIFNCKVKSVLLYGSEIWRLTKKINAQIQTFINRRHRYILGVWWPGKISSEELWQRTRQERIEITIGNGDGLATLWGNLPPTCTQLSLEWNIHGASRKGIPKKSWRRTVEKKDEDLGWHGIKWKGLQKTLSDGKVQRWPYASVGAKRTKHLLGGKNISSNAHKTRSWYVLEVLFKIFSCYTVVPSPGAVHGWHYDSWYISLSSSATQQREMTEFCIVWRTWTTKAYFLNFWFQDYRCVPDTDS